MEFAQGWGYGLAVEEVALQGNKKRARSRLLHALPLCSVLLALPSHPA
jgi:hypothetical protein